MNLNKNIQFSVRYYYEIEKDMNEKVLFTEMTFKNISSKPIVFSTFGTRLGISQLQPIKATKLEQGLSRNLGRSRPPNKDDVIRLKPNEKKVVSSWSWADGVLPYPKYPPKGEYWQFYRLQKNANITISLVQPLVENGDEFGNLIKKGEKLESGYLESAPTLLKYEILSPQEE